jgi:putative restriction endonuclease
MRSREEKTIRADMEREYDAPFFKVLARNDTGETGSHQGGIVIPKVISPYFPTLAVSVGPTSDRAITADLYNGPQFLTTIETRYQIQTWGGTRSPEHRLTQNLGMLRNLARAGDILKFERKTGETDRYKLTLLRRGNPEHAAVLADLHNSSGLASFNAPASQNDFQAAAKSIKSDLSNPFVPIEGGSRVLTIVQRRVRGELFKRDVRLAYQNGCVLCDIRLQTPSGTFEVEAAHIIPIRLNGSNDPRNGIALCHTHHWAFDQHMWTLSPERRVVIPRSIRRIRENKLLVDFDGLPIREPNDSLMLPAEVAIEHHRNSSIQMWGT